MANGRQRETMRVGLPVRALTLRALIETLEPSAEATIRHYNGQLIVEEPDPTLMERSGLRTDDEGGG